MPSSHSAARRWPESVITRLESTPQQMINAVVGQFPVTRDAVTVVAYDETWPAQFEYHASRLRKKLGHHAIRVEHVGSTSVPGLSAKPIIDIDVLVASAEDESSYMPPMQELGYRIVIREPWWHGHRMFIDESGAVNLHVWPDGAGEPIRHILFRNWLRTHSDDRARYAQSKTTLSREFEDEPDRYNLAKNAVIDSIYAKIFEAGRVRIRSYRSDDASETLRVFERAVSITARSHYSEPEIAAWLGANRPLTDWGTDREAVSTFVADVDGEVVGFADLSPAGYIDRLFVDPDHGRLGVGSTLLNHVLEIARDRSVELVSTHASMVARPVFERAGFAVAREETVERNGQALRRFHMIATLGTSIQTRTHIK